MIDVRSNDSDESSDGSSRAWDSGDRWTWIGVGVGCSAIIGIVDGSAISALAWLAMSLLRAFHGMPAIFETVRRWSKRRKRPLLCMVAIGWALVPGPVVGGVFGVLSPILFGLPISAFAGGLLGSLIGPVVAAAEGVVLALLFDLVFRAVFRRSLFDEAA